MKKTTLLTILAAISIAVVGAGCSAMDGALLSSHFTVTPAVTNIVAVVSTNSAGQSETNFEQHVKSAVTNTVYEPSTMAQVGVTAIGALPFPGAGTAGIALAWLATAYAAYRNKKLSVALVKGIDAGRQILQTTPEGQKLDAKFKDALIDHQEISGVLNAASQLVNEYTGDTVKPT